MLQNTDENTPRENQSQKYDIIPPYSRYGSRFVTTSRNVLLYWIVNFVLLPTYASLFYLLLDDILHPLQPIPLLSEGVRFPLATIIGICALTPVLMNFFAPAHWQTGFKHLEVACMSSLLITSHLFFTPNTIAKPIVYASITWLLVGTLQLLLRQPRHIAFLIISPLIVLTGLIVSEIFPLLNEQLRTGIANLNSEILFIGWQWLSLSIALYCIYRIFMWLWISKSSIRKLLPISIAYCLIIFSLYLLNFKAHQVYPANYGIHALIALTILLLSANPTRLLSIQVAYMRSLHRRVRYDYIYSQFSPFVATRNPLNLLVRNKPKWVSINNYALFILICLLGGGIGIPGLLYFMACQAGGGWPSTFTPLNLMTIGVLSAAILLAIYFGLWMLSNRNRYIVTEFQASDEDPARRAALQSIAKLTTHVLVNELQEIATLLKLRQVENLRFGRDDTNAFFVTSGINQEFFDQMQQVVTIGLPNEGKFNLGSFMSSLSRLLARIQVRGEIQSSKTGRVEVWVELKYRNHRSATVDMVIRPENSLEEIDEVLIRPVARQLAIRLLIEWGQVPHLGSSWQALDFFLQGLDASTKRNWWQASSFYRQALQAEETVQGAFGIGHYHLGAALVFQGNWQEGYEHLLTAEADGPPMAEMQYMIALVLLYTYWGELHKKPNVFNEIRYRCQQAMKLRKNFAEAYQLLGTAYYRTGRNLDREASKQSLVSRTIPKAINTSEANPVKTPNPLLFRQANSIEPTIDAQSYYRRALQFYAKALHHYDTMCQKMGAFSYTHSKSESQMTDLLQQRMTAAHQIGDALRSLGYYAEAETYYRDVNLTLPRNIRNLADLAKTYCLGENWQRAEEYLWHEVYKYDVAVWDADVAIHMAWGLLGGIFEHRTTPLKRFIDRLIQARYPQHRAVPKLEKGIAGDQQAKQWFGEAVEFLDFALYQRPRYLEAWRQSNWLDSIEDDFIILSPSVNRLGILGNFLLEEVQLANHKIKQAMPLPTMAAQQTSAPSALFPEPRADFTFQNPDLSFYRTWLGLRIQSYNRNDYWEKSTKEFLLAIGNDQHVHKLLWIQSALVELRGKVAGLLQDANAPQTDLLYKSYIHLQLAQDAYNWWHLAHKIFDELDQATKMSFAGRWAIDLYHELTLLTCRLLSATAAYELLYEVAHATGKASEEWIELWRNKYKDTKTPLKAYHTFSPYVSRYQRATIRAWQAFALLHCYSDNRTRIRIRHTNHALLNRLDREQVLEIVQKDIDFARKLVSPHPLALLVQSYVFRELGLNGQALEVLEHLLDVIAPFDPKQDIGGVVPGNARPEPTTSKDRSELYFLEKVCGRQQFNNIINAASIHKMLADIYSHSGKLDLSVRHLMESIRSLDDSKNHDTYLRLADQLNSMERYAEAQAIVESIRIANHSRPASDLSHLQNAAPSILECIINTRSRRYTESLQNCKEIAHIVELSTSEDYLHELETATIKPGQQEFIQAFKQFLPILEIELRSQDENPEDTQMIQPEMTDVLKKCGAFLEIPSNETCKSLHHLIDHVVKKQDATSLLIAEFDQTFHFPKVFLRLQNNKDTLTIIVSLGKLAFYTLKKAPLQHLLETIFVNQSHGNFGKLSGTFQQIMLGEIVMFFGQRAWEDLSQLAELCNSMAYNRAETGLHIDPYAFVDSACARAIMTYLVQVSERDTDHHRVFTAQLAQYCDTFGWLHYRKAFYPNLEEQSGYKEKYINQANIRRILSLLAKAEQYLKQGIRYDPTRAIIHYHLARIYISYIELIWQSDPKAIWEGNLGNQAHTIDKYLNQAFRAWRSAQQYDQFGRLHTQLSWIYGRINIYKKQWGERQLQGLTGIQNVA